MLYIRCKTHFNKMKLNFYFYFYTTQETTNNNDYYS